MTLINETNKDSNDSESISYSQIKSAIAAIKDVALEERREVARLIGFSDEELMKVTIKTVFFVHGSKPERLTPFVVASPLVEKGDVIALSENDYLDTYGHNFRV